MSEDCLSMILYVPKTLNPASNVPTLMWYVRSLDNSRSASFNAFHLGSTVVLSLLGRLQVPVSMDPNWLLQLGLLSLSYNIVWEL